MSRREGVRSGRFHSITWRLFASVAGCILFVLMTVLLLNSFALKGYYIRQKQRQVSQAYQSINTVCQDAERLQNTLLELQDNRSMTTVLWSGRQLLYSTQNSERFYVPANSDYPPGTYELTVTQKDDFQAGGGTQEPVIRLVGTLSNGWNIYLRSPVAAIEDSIAVTNRFLLFAGGAALLLGLLLVLLVARRYADPIRQLSLVADRMAQLDFSGRYQGQERDEIGRLGNSINAMSAALEKTITQLKNANLQLVADIREKEERDKARQAFIANVSHELKTPVALIGTYAEGLQEDIAVGGGNRAYYCEVIEDEARKMSQLLRRMTMLMQLEGGASQLEVEHFDVAELLRHLMELERIRFDQKEAVLELPPPQPVLVYADPYLIENVLTNYLSNALNHVTSGGRVTANIVPASEGRVRLTVFNTGAPIPTEDLSRIWESFYKVDKARTRAYGGSGIGLSVVAAIMHAHDMPFGVANLEDGVEFYIELPVR